MSHGDPAFVDRAEELGVAHVMRVMADHFAGIPFADGVSMCTCDVPDSMLLSHDSREPHARRCAIQQIAVLFGSPAALQKLRDDAEAWARWAVKAVAEPGDLPYATVIRYQKLVANRPL